MSRGARIIWTRIGLVAGVVGLLELLCQLRVINPLTLIAPSEMATTLGELLWTGRLNEDMAQTFSTVALAFVLAVVIGCAVGAILHALPRARRAVDPLLASYYSIPFFVFYPVLIALFGLNSVPLVAIGFVFAAAAMVIATLNGLDRVPRVLTRTARMYRMSRTATLTRITLPAAAPHLFTGIKLALAYALIGVIGGEFILSGAGLGFSIAYAYNNFDSPTMYALMLFVIVIATVVNGGLHVWEQRLLKRRQRA